MTFLIPLQFQCLFHSQTAIFQLCESCATGLIVTKTNQWLSGLHKNWKQAIWCVDIYSLFFIVSQDWKIAWSKILIVESTDWLCHRSFFGLWQRFSQLKPIFGQLKRTLAMQLANVSCLTLRMSPNGLAYPYLSDGEFLTCKKFFQ